MNGFKALAVASVLAMSLSAQANLIFNGSFEDAAYGDAPSAGTPLITLPSFNSTLSSWVIGGGAIDWLHNAYSATPNASSGERFLDLAGPAAGNHLVAQTFSTQVGQTYTVKYDFAHMDCNCGAATGDLTASVAGGSSLTGAYFIDDASGNTAWTTKTFSFKATGSQATLKFLSSTSLPQYMLLDNISVSAVPEPETYALMLAGLGALGFIARRRRTH